jgi:N-acetylglucosaminyldiphosphoundecaprenol N-acetyl-beta-D-mannosaminyltransferase
MENSYQIMSLRVTSSPMGEVVKDIMHKATLGEAGYTCLANVQMCMDARRNPAYRDDVSQATRVVADGMPLVWALRLSGDNLAERIRAVELLESLLSEASTAECLTGLLIDSRQHGDLLEKKISEQYKGLDTRVFVLEDSPHDAELARDITISGTRLLIVCLPQPDAEQWMAAHHKNLDLPMVGIGTAWEIFANVRKSAPSWMQKAGLEWLYKLLGNHRLLLSYLRNNPPFLMYLLKLKLFGKD